MSGNGKIRPNVEEPELDLKNSSSSLSFEGSSSLNMQVVRIIL